MAAFTVVLSPDPDRGGYTAICPAMPGAVTEGDTREEALEAMSLVMAVWIELAAEDGHQPLAESPSLIADEIASVLNDREEAGWDHTIETTMLAPAQPVAA
jgi:predicted RNase H-like HicB family nuclease